MTKPKQDWESRRERRAKGLCPTHGIPGTVDVYIFSPMGVRVGYWYFCPRSDCNLRFATLHHEKDHGQRVSKQHRLQV